MSEVRSIPFPNPVEFSIDGRHFVQYGMSPVKMASLRASIRKAAKGTRKNPIIKDGKEYVYVSDGRLLELEHFDLMTVKKNTLSSENVLSKEVIDRLKEFESKPVVPDDECPELTDEQISEILLKAKQQRYMA